MNMQDFLTPLKTGPYARMTAYDKFWSQAEIGGGDECWHWGAKMYGNGYGCFRWRTVDYLAHRVSVLLSTGVNPGRMVVMHSCDNKSCVNPVHLSVGTQVDNIGDMVSKGRANPARGERHPKTFLTQAQVAEIKWLLSNSSLMQKEIAKMYGVRNQNVISYINSGTVWGHVSASAPASLPLVAEVAA